MHNCWLAAPYKPLCCFCCLQYRLWLCLASRLLPDTAAAFARLSGCTHCTCLRMLPGCPQISRNVRCMTALGRKA